MSHLHRHVWKITNHDVQQSPWDAISELRVTNLSNLTPEFFRRDVIVTYRCERCGSEKVERR